MNTTPQEPRTDRDAPLDRSVASRRQFNRRAVQAGTVVAATLSARSALGAECWSGQMSGNMSGPVQYCVGGRSPGYYKSNVEPHGGNPGWPTSTHMGASIEHGAANVLGNGTISRADKERFSDPNPAAPVPGTKFGAIFSSAEDPIASMTLMQVLWQKSGSFEFHAVAMYFNSLNFSSYMFKPAVAHSIINSILATGSYIDQNGHSWSADEMKTLVDQSYHT